ncbi:MAG: GUN4 domain-containing protein [Leptolyngbyaceae cyanobacterium bins.349]|nr:GUN4 domain-containing protein [Leptolyngbyaceae cyanobacterium bins.349]
MPKKLIFLILVASALALTYYLKQQSSSTTISYRHLEKLLASGKWQEADQKTSKLILVKASGRGFDEASRGGVDYSEFVKFPCNDLVAIDNLWLKYSRGRFGLSVQEFILQPKIQNDELSSSRQKRFYQKVGWTGKPPYRIVFNLNAPQGHLPSPQWLLDADPDFTIDGMLPYKLDALLLRTKECHQATDKR